MSKPSTFFRGSELPRLLVLLGILIAGMVYFWQYLYQTRVAPPTPPVARVPLEPIVPDRSLEFQMVEDRTEIRLRDMPAYRKLLDQVNELSPQALRDRCRRDVLSIQIWEHPERYRGVPIEILGTALRVMTYESKLSRTGRLYEAWVVTSDSQRNPYVCVFEEAPPGFPIGDNISERILFEGYFLKMMKYQSGKDLAYYISPVLIGRIGWDARSAAAGDDKPAPWRWMAVAVGLMFVISFFRWMTGLRRSLAIGSRRHEPREHVTEEISPEALAAWLENAGNEPPEHDDEPKTA